MSKDDPVVKGGQGHDDDIDGKGVFLWSGVCLVIIGMLFIAIACFRQGGAL